MTARLADRFDQVGAQYVGDGGQLGFVELAQVGRGFNARKARVARGVDHPVIFPFAVVTGKAKGPFARRNARQCGEPLGNGQAIARKARWSERATCRAGARTGRWALPARPAPEIGSASCGERGCRYVAVPGGAVSL